MTERFGFTDKQGFEEIVFSNNHYSGAFGASTSTFFKPFTTNHTGVVTAPKYGRPIFATGYATSQGLNPYGTGTFYENIISGPSAPANININLNPTDVRSYGLKNPQTWVGWGYDIFGNPAPNQNPQWNVSGVNAISGPSGRFANSGLVGADLNKSQWLAGPEDKRWDPHRKVWTSPQSVYAASVTYVYIRDSNLLIGSGSSVTGSYFYDQLRYKVLLNDGMANIVTLTDVPPINNRPLADTFRGNPLASGDFCFIVHYPTSSGLRFGVCLPGWEVPATIDCDTGTEDFILPVGADPIEGLATSLDPMTGFEFFSALTASSGWDVEDGGTGWNTISPREILVGNNANAFSRMLLVAGSGIVIDFNSLNNPTGVVTISTSGSVATIDGAGLNTNIHQISGLTTPLSIDQGGTSSNTKNFVDLSTAQTIGGMKSFTDQVQVGYGISGVPGLAFALAPRYGLSYHTGSLASGVAIISNGVESQLFTSSGIYISERVHIRNSTTPGLHSPLIVQQNTQNGGVDISGYPYAHSVKIQEWWDKTGGVLAAIGPTGEVFAKSFISSGVINSGNNVYTAEMPLGFTGYPFYSSIGGTQTFSVSATGHTLSMGPLGNRLTLGYQGGGNGTILLPTGFGPTGYALIADGAGNLSYGLISPGVTYTDENAQDAIASGWTRTNSTIFTYNDASDTMSITVDPSGFDLTAVSGVLSIAKGGTGQTTAVAAIAALLPTQAAQSGSIYRTNGTAGVWDRYSYGTSPVLNITSNQTNLAYNPLYNQLRISPNNTGYIIEGIASGIGGMRLSLYNAGNSGISVRHKSTTTTAGNAIYIPTETRATIRPKDSWELIYDDVDAEWKLVGGLEPYLRDMRYCTQYFEDWVVTSNIPSFSAGGGSITSAQVQFGPTINGVIKINTKTVGGVAGLRGGSMTSVNAPLVFESWIAQETLSNGTDNSSVFVGLATASTTTITPADGIGFVYHFAATGAWMWRQSASSVVTSGNTNVTPTSAAATRFNHLKFIVDYVDSGSGMVKYYIDNNLVGSGTTNIPLATTYVGWHILNTKTLGSTTFMSTAIDAVRFDKYGVNTRF